MHNSNMPSKLRIYTLIFLLLLQYILTFLTLAYILLMHPISSLVCISNDSHVKSYSFHNIVNHPNTFRRSSTTRWRERQEHLYQFPGVVGNFFLNPDDSNNMPNPQYCWKLPEAPQLTTCTSWYPQCLARHQSQYWHWGTFLINLI